ncbi:MAG: hypothetical protein ACFFDV_00785 [Candidatus Thorarchaeota archaeon]
MGIFDKVPIWPRLLLKALIVMLIPLQFYITSSVDVILLIFNGFLFTPASDGYYPYAEIVRLDQPFFATTILSNFVLGLFIAFPAIFFNYKVLKSPLNKPLRNLAIGIMVISSFMVFMAMLIIMPIYSPIYYYNYMLIQNIQTFPTFVIGAFIILPMIQRQAALIASPENLHTESMETVRQHVQLSARREMSLATILWAGLYFLPYFIINMGSFYSTYIQLYSFSYMISFDSYPYIGYEYTNVVYAMAVPVFILPILGILSALRFVYVRDIYRYLKHEIAYRRLMYIGILGDIFPVIAFTAMIGFLSGGVLVSLNAIPIPLLVFLGLGITRLHRSVLPHANRIWADVDARMWFEEEEQSLSVIPEIAATPEMPHRPTEEKIKVPITYMLMSHIRRRRNNNHFLDETEE